MDEINDGSEDAESFLVGNLFIAQWNWSKYAHLFDEHLQRIFVTFKWNLSWFEYVPIMAPYQTDQLRKIQLTRRRIR